MENLSSILANNEDRQAIKQLTLGALNAISPEEIEIVMDFFDPICDMLARNEKVIVDSKDIGGGFGGNDLFVLIVVPTIAGALGNLLAYYFVKTIDQLKQHLKREEKPVEKIEIALNDLQGIIEIRNFPGGKKQIKKIRKVLLKTLAENLMD